MDERETTFTRQARRALSEGRPQDAIQILDSWLRLSPDDAGGWEVVRDAQLELGDLNEAEHAAREVARIRPESADAWCDLGVVLRKAGNADEARNALHRALSIQPGFERATAELEVVGRSEPQKPKAPSKPEKRPRRPEPHEPEEKAAEEKPAAKPPPRPRATLPKLPPPPPPPPPERSADAWKVRSPEGTVHGPYTEAEVEEQLRDGDIGEDWGARFGGGRITTVREALGPGRCDELLRQRVSDLADERASRPPEFPPAEVYHAGDPCPYCGRPTVASEKKSASGTRLIIFILGLFFLPVWLLLLATKDKIRYTCYTCGMEWDAKA